MHKILVAFTGALLAQVPAATAQQSDVMAVVRQFVDGFNKGDVKAAVEQTGSLLTVALRKEAAGWRITAWSWSTN